MEQTAYSVLVVDDEEPICRLLQKELASAYCHIKTAFTLKQAETYCSQEAFDIVILDVRLPDGNGIDLLPSFLKMLPDAKIIMITGYANVDEAVKAMRMGAYDFITKPFSLENMELTVKRALDVLGLERENRTLKMLSSNEQPLVGNSKAIEQIKFLVGRVAPTNVPVLLTGESGTGKDVVASAIHNTSARSSLPFIIKNCASLQPELARSELFGHVKGAFTNAVHASEGLMTFASKGTLFLDEVGELPLEVQAQLLRVLESRRYRRVGEKQERHADVRFIFATNRNLQHEVQCGRFHEALFHRINVFQINLPTLKERKEDIPLLVQHFLAQLGKGKRLEAITEHVLQLFLQYNWPGNIRELKNVIERGIILSEDGVITEKYLPVELLGGMFTQPLLERSALPNEREDCLADKEHVPSNANIKNYQPASPCREGKESSANLAAQAGSLAECEQQHIIKMLAFAGGNKNRAAQMLGISRKTLYRKLERFGIIK